MVLLNEHIPGPGAWDQGAGQAGNGRRVIFFLLERREKNLIRLVCTAPDNHLSACWDEMPLTVRGAPVPSTSLCTPQFTLSRTHTVRARLEQEQELH